MTRPTIAHDVLIALGGAEFCERFGITSIDVCAARIILKTMRRILINKHRQSIAEIWIDDITEDTAAVRIFGRKTINGSSVLLDNRYRIDAINTELKSLSF